MRHPTDDRVWGEYVHEANLVVLKAKVALIEAYSPAAAQGLSGAMRILPGAEAKHSLALLELILERISSTERRNFDARAREIARVPLENLKRAYEVAAYMEDPTFLLLSPGTLADVYGQLQTRAEAAFPPGGEDTPVGLAYDVLIRKLLYLVYLVLEERGEKSHRLRLVSSRKESALVEPRPVPTGTANHLRLVR